MECEKNIGMSFKIISNQLKRVVNKKLGNNITHIQIFILRFLYENKDKKDIFQKDIEKLLDIRRSTTTEILNVMERNNLLERVDSLSDKRQKMIVLSGKGTKYLKDFEKIVLKTEKEILNNVSQEEKDIFFNVLEKIKNNLNNL